MGASWCQRTRDHCLGHRSCLQKTGLRGPCGQIEGPKTNAIIADVAAEVAEVVALVAEVAAAEAEFAAEVAEVAAAVVDPKSVSI